MADKWATLAAKWGLKTPDLRALWELSGNPEWEVLLEYLRVRREVAVHRLLAANPDQVVQRQGELKAADQVLCDLRKIIAQADEIGGRNA